MKTHALKKWHDRFEEALAVVTFHWFFSGSIMGTLMSKKWHEDFKDPLCECG